MGDPPGSVHVLHVDDDPDFARVAAELLEKQGEQFTVTTASDAEVAIDRLAEDGFDCIVSDYDMPGRNGIEFLEAVRETYPDLPFILFTGKGSEEVASRAISAGVTDYLQKEGGIDQYAILANRIENAVQRQRALDGQKRADRQFQAIFNDPEKLISVVDPDGRVRNVNDTAMKYVDADREDVIDVPFWETSWWADVDRSNAEELAARVADGEYVEFELDRDPPHRDRYVLSGIVRPVTDESGTVVAFVASARDVTEQVQRKRELKQYERMVNTMLEAACIYDADGNFKVVNEYLAEFYGTTPGQLEGKQSNLIPKVRADNEGDPYAELLAGEREEVRGEVEGQFPGHGYEALEYRLTPLRVNGKIEGVVGVTHEITELKKRERTLERQNERLDQFASVVAHDLRNPLNVATGRLRLVAEDCNSDHLPDVTDALDRMEALIDDLLTVARESDPVEATEPVSLREVAFEGWREVPADDAELVVDADVRVLAERRRLERLLANLLRNAIEHGSMSPRSSSTREDAVEHGSTSPDSHARQDAGRASTREPSVADAPEDAVEHGSTSPPSQAPEDSEGLRPSGSRTQSDDAVEHGGVGVTITVGTLGKGFYVADDGRGIDADKREQIFEAGYSTSDDGTGFGLSIVEEIVQAHDWNISVTDSEDGGARFEITGVEIV